ncbi:hypothetical protein [Sphingobacterium humi]|uniref:SH3 domain-containing protein n=1 Tax=Sphingobacterium humi TaxID=1796905 RepID=A0A6N8KW12_9SPHI|nr:hypothetical protein [Sphingobacterium humi]MVZ60919.1 hypothetical protein [Sphingobacterium humi]
MRKYFLFLWVILLISSCRVHTTENYYTVTITEDANIYFKNDLNSNSIDLVKSGEPIYMILDKSSKGFRKVNYKGKVGYVYRPSFKAYNKSDYRNSSGSVILQDSLKNEPIRTYTAPASGGTVHVKGYYRKNGTYVRPHTRSAPRRR